jgi:hypothetical protein
LQPHRPWLLPVPLVPAAARGLAPRGQGRPGLLLCRQGGLACLAIATLERVPARGSHATEAARRTIAGFGLDFEEGQKGFEQNRAWSIVNKRIEISLNTIM